MAVYHIDELINSTTSCEHPDGWYPSRPHENTSLITRLKIAYGVFTGKYSALCWNSKRSMLMTDLLGDFSCIKGIECNYRQIGDELEIKLNHRGVRDFIQGYMKRRMKFELTNITVNYVSNIEAKNVDLNEFIKIINASSI